VALRSAARNRQAAPAGDRNARQTSPFSNNWKKAKARVQRIHVHIGNARRDFLHKATTTISQNFGLALSFDLTQ
jgi:putative transposase